MDDYRKGGGSDAEILIEAGLVTSGCLENVLWGKAYVKSLFCLKTVIDAIERLLAQFIVKKDEPTNPEALLSLIQSCTRENLDITLHGPSVVNILLKCMTYEDKVRNGHLGKTAIFWLSVIDHT